MSKRAASFLSLVIIVVFTVFSAVPILAQEQPLHPDFGDGHQSDSSASLTFESSEAAYNWLQDFLYSEYSRRTRRAIFQALERTYDTVNCGFNLAIGISNSVGGYPQFPPETADACAPEFGRILQLLGF